MAAASTRSLSIIGAPTSAGAYGPGQERTPGVFREHGLVDALRDGSLDVVDRGDGRTAPWQPDEANPTAHNADTVVAVATELADSVAAAFSDGHDILVLGGDCTLEIGTVAGAVADELGARCSVTSPSESKNVYGPSFRQRMQNPVNAIWLSVTS